MVYQWVAILQAGSDEAVRRVMPSEYRLRISQAGDNQLRVAAADPVLTEHLSDKAAAASWPG